MGPRKPRQKTLSATEEATCIAFRIQARLPLDDCLYALQLMFPHLARSTLHRLFQRHQIHRLPARPARPIKQLPNAQGVEIGHFYLDAADIRTGDGRANMFFAFDRQSKIAFARLYDYAHPENGPDFLDALVKAIPYRIRSVLTGAGKQFVNQNTAHESGTDNATIHPFSLACRHRRIDHDLLPPDQPWNIGQIGTVRAPVRGTPPSGVHYESHDDLREHFLAFFETYNFDRRLKTLRGLTPFEYVCRCWEEQPLSFRHDPRNYGRMLNG